MLKLDQISAQAGSFTLKPLDMEIAPGGCHALLGPSGAGKSTVLELIVGFRELKSGQILMNGKDLIHVPVERRGIGYLPQQLALFPHLSVKENILYGIRCRRNPSPTDLAAVASLTDAMGLTQITERKPTHLSGGERQRVALARALAPAPELLILDEPFSALNEALRRELWRLLKDLQKEYGVAMLMVTHDLEEAYFFGEQVHILIDGCLHQSGPRRMVFDRPATLEVARFLDIQNLFPAQVIRRDNFVTVLDLNSLGSELNISNGALRSLNLNSGDHLVVGIRSEFVALRGMGRTDSSDSLRLRGSVAEILDTIHGAVILFRPEGKDALVKVAIGAHEATTLGQTEIEISLPTQRLFLIPLKNAHQKSAPA
jgi:ABC-type Fe3+/spermidine/putrescine transport system ATPase subunit